MNYPFIDPIAISIGPIDIRWYSLAYIAGILIGLFLIKKFVLEHKKNITFDDIDNFLIYIIVGIILGGRLGYIIFYNLSFYFNNPLEIFKIWNGGMSFHGAVIGIIFLTLLFSKFKNKNFFDLTDIICLVSPIGIFFGRVANFINGELYGKITDNSFGIIFPEAGNQPRHPSQIYEAFFEGLILFFILNYFFYVKDFKKSTGSITGLFLIFYSLFRIIIEFYREPDTQLGYIFDFLTMGQLLSLPLLIVGIIIFLKSKKFLYNE